MPSLADRQAKFAEIEALLANDLGLGDLAALSEQQRNDLHDAVEEAIETWQSEVENEMPAREPTTPLQVLLRSYSELEDDLLDERDASLTDDDKDMDL